MCSALESAYFVGDVCVALEGDPPPILIGAPIPSIMNHGRSNKNNDVIVDRAKVCPFFFTNITFTIFPTNLEKKT
jgi:hypothetical protein